MSGNILPFTDEQLIAIRTAVSNNIPPERYAQWMIWVLASLNVNVLVEMFVGLKNGSLFLDLHDPVRYLSTDKISTYLQVCMNNAD